MRIPEQANLHIEVDANERLLCSVPTCIRLLERYLWPQTARPVLARPLPCRCRPCSRGQGHNGPPSCRTQRSRCGRRRCSRPYRDYRHRSRPSSLPRQLLQRDRFDVGDWFCQRPTDRRRLLAERQLAMDILVQSPVHWRRHADGTTVLEAALPCDYPRPEITASGLAWDGVVHWLDYRYTHSNHLGRCELLLVVMEDSCALAGLSRWIDRIHHLGRQICA